MTRDIREIGIVGGMKTKDEVFGYGIIDGNTLARRGFRIAYFKKNGDAISWEPLISNHQFGKLNVDVQERYNAIGRRREKGIPFDMLVRDLASSVTVAY